MNADAAVIADALAGAERDTGERMLRYFRFAHLPENLQLVSSRFASLAIYIVADVEASPERTVALRKLLEAKDCAVRARLD